MKSIILCLSSYAQFNKGDKYLGGELSARTNSGSTPGFTGSTTTTNNGWGIGPTVGFFLNNKTAVGFTLGYFYSSSSNTTSSGVTTENISKNLSSSIFIKQFFAINDNFYFTLSEAITFSRGTTS